MAECRDWQSTLFPASWNGVPFFVARDDDSGGRRVIVHEFVHRDDPFDEDIGEAPQYFDVDAYVASDAADAEANSLTAAMRAGGRGVLVLPTHGPIRARCITFRRTSERDRAGFIAFSLRYVRVGANSALASVLSVANLVYAGADRLGAAMAEAFAAGLAVTARPDYVVDAAVSGIRDGISVFEEIRKTNAVDAEASAAIGLRALELGDDLSVMFATPDGRRDAAAELYAIARDLGDAMAPAAAVGAFSEVADYAVPVETPAAGTTAEAAANKAEALRVVRLAALATYIEATVRASYPSRREAVTARADVVERCDFELERSTGAKLNDVVGAITDMRGNAADYLSRLMVDLAPIVTVSANVPLPSLWWSYRLYGDPTRASELVARNHVVHPSFMPREFEALAS